MKIGILTQRLFTNYGGLMQSLALQTVLERMGHEVLIFDREYNGKEMNSLIVRLKKRSRLYLTNFIKWIIRRPLAGNPNAEEISYVRQNITPFIAKYHHSTPKIYTAKDLKSAVLKWSPDAMVVGSDQVWRPMYSPMISNYFLDFAKDWNIKKISYAASFGVDEWEYNPRDTKLCSKLVRSFDAVSVREKSAVHLCKQYLDVDAEFVLDPTLLLDKDFYVSIIENEDEPHVGKSLFCYVLDTDENKNTIIKTIARSTGLEDFYCMPKASLTYQNVKSRIDDCVFPRPTQWLRSFMDAEMVVADSFHGLVFSIIFNKPFWILANDMRGNARLESILDLFDLNNRMIDCEDFVHIDWKEPIDWNRVNARWNELKMESLDFLNNCLN